MKIQKIKLRCSQVMLGNNCETMGNNYAKQTNTKEMLLLEFEFVTLSGYKTDLVAVLSLSALKISCGYLLHFRGKCWRNRVN